jgi:hypothetical protein
MASGGLILDAIGGLAGELGYDRVAGGFVRPGDAEIDAHPFAPEIRAILREADDGVSAGAVFCIDQVPTVCLVDEQALSVEQDERRAQVRRLCERLWNQNLARIVLVASQGSVEAWAVDNASAQPERTSRTEGGTSPWSFSGLVSGEVLRGRDDWFDPAKRVDRELLDNISELVRVLEAAGLDAGLARRLIARVIFVTYLEDRRIIADSYRSKRQVKPLIDLLGSRDAEGLTHLFASLRTDVNGDFLSTADGERGWATLPDGAFDALHQFLKHTTLRTGQTSLWRYDFSEIPIELIASIYETFLSQKDAEGEETGAGANKRRQGAYYTPRALADWVVNLALQGRDILLERIYDPACGSGMLLTASYRRLVRAYESAASRSGGSNIADFNTRKMLLVDHIFGADIDEDACQLTGFSLYLALLADLLPSDLEELREGGHKLPSLASNIRRGVVEGDFFSEANQSAAKGRQTVVISNPPWRKLTEAESAAKAMSAWVQRQSDPKPRIPKKQIAAAFALGAADLLAPAGRVAMILPVGLFVSNDKAQREFRAHLIGRYRILQIVNFADMRRLIFADAIHPFAVLIAEALPSNDRFQDVEGERFEYWTPKTDMSLALGRLAVHGADRADLPVSALIDESPQLGMRYWGSEQDTALLTKLRRHGRVRDLIADHGWLDAKGFHAKDEDKRRRKETWYKPIPDWMKERPFLPARRLSIDAPVAFNWAFEKEIPLEQIPRIPPRRLFEGPRVIWPDGTNPTDGVKAIYADTPFTFQHSLAVLSAPDTALGRQTARFLTAYLRSPLALWLLLLLSSSVASERPKLHLEEALDWPFWTSERHPQPEIAAGLLERIDNLFDALSTIDDFGKPAWWQAHRAELNQCVYDFFGLTDDEIRSIEELADFACPALQPTTLSYKSLSRPLRASPTQAQTELYCKALVRALGQWRDATAGQGEISAVSWTGRSVPVGAAVLTLDGVTPARPADDSIAGELIETYNRLNRASPGEILTVPDLALVEGARIYLIKPMIARFWLERTAVEDASRLALQLQAVVRVRAAR